MSVRFYEAYQDPAGLEITLLPADQVDGERTAGLLTPDAKLLYRFEAGNLEEATAIHYLRMGWEPFRPDGPAEACQRCGAKVYPQESGECWQCGTIAPRAV